MCPRSLPSLAAPFALAAGALLLLAGCPSPGNAPAPDLPEMPPEMPAGTPTPAPIPPASLGPVEIIGGRRVHRGDTSCGGYPRLTLEMGRAPDGRGYCMGLVAYKDAPFSPRAILESPAEPGVFFITDFQRWSGTQGKVWRLKEGALSVVVDGLSLPHGLRVGPGPGGEGAWVYVGEDVRISRFDPRDPSRRETVIEGLPPIYYTDASGKQRKNSFHPLSQFVFDGDGSLIVNVGAPTDHCSGAAGQTCAEGDRGTPSLLGKNPADPTLAGAVLRRYPALGGGRFSPDYALIAKGLRNSMGLALHGPSQTLVQAENSRDFPESSRPFEEINVLLKGERGGANPPHFGWPYCYDFTATSDEWAGGGAPITCAPDSPPYRPPWVLGPPHGAPLDMLYYEGDLFPELKGQLLVSWHGYREAGHRLTAYPVDDLGRPKLLRDPAAARYWTDDAEGTEPTRALPFAPVGSLLRASQHTELVSGWYESPNVRPMGAPVGMTVARDGALWLVEDKTGAILRMAPFAGAPFPPAPRPSSAEAMVTLVAEDPPALARYERVRDEVLTGPHCGGCHDHFDAGPDPFGPLRYILGKARWVVPGDAGGSYLYAKLRPASAGALPDMPPPEVVEAKGPLPEAQIEAVSAFIEALPRAIYQGDASASNIRSQPNTDAATKCGTLPKGAYVGATGATMDASGYTWVPVRIPPGSPYLKAGTSGFSCQGAQDDTYYLATSGLTLVGP